MNRTRNRSTVARRGMLVLLGTMLGVALSVTPYLVHNMFAKGPAGQPPPAAWLPHPALAHALQVDGKPIALADVAERSMASIVNISSTRRRAMSQRHGHPFESHPFFRDFFRHFGPGAPSPSPRQEHSLGSGVIISIDGIVLTNNHVIEGADRIRVVLADKTEYTATVVGSDPKSDLAVLRIKGGKNLKALPMGDSDKLRLGDVVLAMGNPFGVGQTVTMGIVSAKGRANMGIVDYEDFIQTDAAINPGNSGGALVNMRGELVGINTAILSRSGGYQGIGFAIPSNMAQPITASLLKTGKVVRGWLGVVIQEVTAELSQAMKLPVKRGVLISDVEADGPGHKVGLKRGDVVVSIDGQRVDSTGHLRNMVAARGAGTQIKLELYRDGARQTLTAKLGELPSSQAQASSRSSDTDVVVAPLDDAARRRFNIPGRVDSGVVVQRLAPDSAAARAGLRPGDVILEVNRVKIASVRSFNQSYGAAQGRVLLLVYREGGTFYMLLNK